MNTFICGFAACYILLAAVECCRIWFAKDSHPRCDFMLTWLIAWPMVVIVGACSAFIWGFVDTVEFLKEQVERKRKADRNEEDD